jgi:predicted nucleic-acid-binding protein
MREIVVDANILLRYLTDDPRELADRATALLETAEREGVALVIAPLILAEVVYVLQSVYSWERRDIAARLLNLVAAAVFTVSEAETMLQALEWYRDTPGLDFADVYIAALARTRSESHVMSFDRRMRRLTGIHLVSDPLDIVKQ